MAGEFKPTEAATSVFTFIKTFPAFTARFVLFSISAMVPWIIYIVFVFSKIIEHVGTDGEKWNGIEPFMAMLTQIGAVPILLATLVLTYALFVSTQAMAMRKAVLNQEIGFFGLSWGGFETRLLIVHLAVSFVPILMILPLFSALPYFSELDTGRAIGPGIMLVGLTFLLLFFVFIPLSIYAVGRWGLYGICALTNGNFGIKAAAELSKGRFWPLFGTFALTYLIWMVISGIFQNLGSALLGLSSFTMTDPKDFAEFMAIFTPELIGKFVVYLLVLMVIGTLTYLAYICTGAFAYLKIRQSHTQTTGVN